MELNKLKITHKINKKFTSYINPATASKKPVNSEYLRTFKHAQKSHKAQSFAHFPQPSKTNQQQKDENFRKYRAQNATGFVKETNLEGVFVPLELAKLTNDAIELVLAHRVPFVFPFPYGNHGAAFWEHQAQESPSQSVSDAARAFRCSDGRRLRLRMRFRREVSDGGDGAPQGSN